MPNGADLCWEIVPYTAPIAPTKHGDRGSVLDVSTVNRKTYPHFIGVGPYEGANIKVDVCSELPQCEDNTADAVFSAYCLHELADQERALSEWSRVLAVGGHLVIYLPSAANPPQGVVGVKAEDVIHKMWLACPSGWTLMERQEREEEHSFLLVFRKRADGVFDEEAWSRTAAARAMIPKRICLVRYGGFGDMLQMAAILPALKRQGWHVTVMTEPRGRDIIAHDPHVDEFFIQANDQVPNGRLFDFWNYWAKKFDRFVNFSESVEGTLLAMPGRVSHQWPHAVRHKYLNRNYFEWMAELAQVEYVPEGRFYPTVEEEAWAKKTRHDINGFVVLFALSGSAYHKFYRWQDEVIGGLLRYCPKARVVTIGDEASKLLEQGWEKEPRVIQRAGQWSIRETLAFARECDAVWGPETGVLNSVANDPMLKVVLLSHSSVENLTKHWVNTASIEPYGQHCYPCHQLHSTTEFCDADPASGAMCQIKITPERVLVPLMEAYKAWEARYYHRPAKVIPIVSPLIRPNTRVTP